MSSKSNLSPEVSDNHKKPSDSRLDHDYEKHRQRIRRGRTGKRTKDMIDIAKDRIRILLSRAEYESIRNQSQERANRYVELARKIGMRYNVRIGKHFRNRFCRSCNTYLGASSTCQVRTRCGKLIIRCKTCGRIKRIHMKNRKE